MSNRNLELFPDLHPALDGRSAVTESHRCLNCFDAPCMGACPTHIDVPGFIKRIASGNLKGSARVILESNVLGMSCSRACPVEVLCEGACVLNKHNEKPIQIGLLQRHAMETYYQRAEASGDWGFSLPPAARKARVACVGGGPASLACAAELRRRGYRVTVFDNRPLPGGLSTYGIAEYKLRSEDSLREVAMIRAMGVEFQSAEVGANVSLEELERRFEVVFLGFGLGAMQRLGIPGEHLPGVVDALSFIERYKTGEDPGSGRCVAVIGGGNTAIDAAAAARRLGAEEVHLFYRRGREEMPAFHHEYEHALSEGIIFHWRAQPVAVIEGKGRAAGVKFVQTRQGPPENGGRPNVEPVHGTDFNFLCDLVIPALGQSRLADLLAGTRGIELDKGSVRVDRQTGRTSNPRYFAGGDCVNGGREIVDAVADGKRAALAIAAQFPQ
ncbi:MAG TPA: NAD(P)-dependent oxidoreductase [Spirochaetia bacterium]|nr:NAD(P)-dependent oxidoreductase [Spirochaetia bacterium]